MASTLSLNLKTTEEALNVGKTKKRMKGLQWNKSIWTSSRIRITHTNASFVDIFYSLWFANQHSTETFNSNMSIFYHEEEPPNPSKRCKFLAACLTDAFSNCHIGRRLPTSSPEAEDQYITSDFDEEQEVIVSAIRSAAMEKLRRKPSSLTESFSFVYSSKSGDLFISQKGVLNKKDHGEEDDEKEEFLSVRSCFSCCSTAATSRDVFLSVKTSLSRCSSLNGIDFKDFPRQSIIQQFRHCEGWPFGLCRKAVLLPPLPKSPSESWSWRKGTKYVKMV